MARPRGTVPAPGAGPGAGEGDRGVTWTARRVTSRGQGHGGRATGAGPGRGIAGARVAQTAAAAVSESI